jgi:hypothetical protein
LANLEELVIQLSADTKDLQTQMKSAVQIMEKSTNEMQKSVEEMSKSGGKDVSFLQNAFGTMAGFIGGQAVLAALGAAKDAIVGLFKDGIDGAIEAQEAFQSFSFALASTGNYSAKAAAEFRDFADAQQNLTGISAEAYLSTGKLLAVMTGLSGPTLQNATKSIADLSTIMKTDMDTAAKLFSKGVENSTEVFKRFGFQIEDGATKAERAANIMEFFNSKFGGAAQAQAKTYSGALTIMQKSFGEVTEEMGNILVQNPVMISAMNSLSKIFISISDIVKENKQQFMELAGKGIIFVIREMASLVEAVNDFYRAFELLSFVVTAPFEKMITYIKAAKAAASGDFQGAADIIANGIKNISASFDDAMEGNDTLVAIRGNLLSMAASANTAFKDLQANGATVDASMGGVAGSTNKAKLELTAYQEEVKAFALALAQSASTQAGIYALDSENLKAQFEAKLLTEEEYLIRKQELQTSYMEQEQAMLDQAIAQGLVKGEAKTQAELALLQKQNAQNNMMAAERTKFEDAQNKTRQDNLKSSLGTIASLSSSGNKELAAIGKAAAISQATMDGWVAVQKALASAPPPFNYGLAAAVGVATAANVAKIVGTPLATGIDSVPGIGSNDNFPAVLAPNERVVPSKTNEDLTEFLRTQSSQPRSQISVNIQMNDLFTSDPREMGRKIIETINEVAQANGITILGSTV